MLHFGIMGKIMADDECSYYFTVKCQQGRYEDPSQCVTYNAASTTRGCALEKRDNPCLCTRVAGMTVEAIVSLDFKYHYSCYK